MIFVKHSLNSVKIERTLRKYCEGKYLIVASNDEDNVILSRTLKENIGIPVFMVSVTYALNTH